MMVNNDLVGTVLGNCTLEKVIGSGILSTVYLATQHHPLRQVAVKVLQPRSLSRDEFVLRFRREAALLAHLEHSNIIPLLDYDEHDQLAYLIMPYVAGGSLEQQLKTQEKRSIQQAFSFLLQAASALDHAHALNIIHRNLKPSNFLFHPDGRLVLADFGVAHVAIEKLDIDQSTLLGGISPLYLSPEMVRGEPLNAFSDVYQLGVILFQMLSGHVPFKADSSYAIMRQHLQEPLPSLHVLNPDVPLALDTILQKATAKKCEDRYASAGELARAFSIAITKANVLQPYKTHHLFATDSNIVLMHPSFSPFVFSAIEMGTPLDILPSEEQWQEPLIPTDVDFSCIKQQIVPSPMTILYESRQYKPFLLSNLPFFVLLFLSILAIAQVLNAFAFLPQTSSDKAKALLHQYYEFIDQHNYRSAYSLEAASVQQQMPYSRFVAFYRQTFRSNLVFNQTVERSQTEVYVVMYIQMQKQSTQGFISSAYEWSGVVGKQRDGSWKIEQGVLH